MLRLQQWAIAWCVVMVVFLSIIQFAPGLSSPPFFLYLVFSGVWVFGAIMLYAFPMFGAIGTTLYGILLGVQLFMMHGVSTLNVALAVASFIGAALAAALFVELRKRRGGIAV